MAGVELDHGVMRRLGYRIDIEDITPEHARNHWLPRMGGNRPLSARRVARYSRDMSSGKWRNCGDPFRWNDRECIDGRHRIHACIQAGYTIKDALILRGFKRETQEWLDQGGNRTVGDHLHMRGYDSASALAAAARMLFRIKHQGEWQSWGKATNRELIALVEKHDKLPISVKAVGRMVRGIPPSIVAATHYIGSYLLDDTDHATAFVSVLSTGERTYDGDPVHAWREKMVWAQSRSRRRYTIYDQLVTTIYAWNKFRADEVVRNFKVQNEASFDDLDLDLI